MFILIGIAVGEEGVFLTVTLILILSGTLLVYAGECRNPASVGGMRFGEGILASLFQSVTFRTAGFSVRFSKFVIVVMWPTVGVKGL